jgi:hypothetical protein
MRLLPFLLLLTLLTGCTKPAPPKEAPKPLPTPPALPAGVTLIEDPAERHNTRLLAYSAFFSLAVQNYERTHGHLPTDLPALIDSGFLWLLPDTPRPHRYEYLQNPAPESDPFWKQLAFVFTPEQVLFGAYPLAAGQGLDNPQGQTPMRSTIIKPTTTPATDIEAEKLAAMLADPKLTPALRVNALRSYSGDPATRLALHIYDSLTILPDHFTRLNNRLPANFAELIQGEFEVTDPFRALQVKPADDVTLVAVIDLFIVPAENAFLKQISFQHPRSTVTRESIALVLDGGKDVSQLPRASELLGLLTDPFEVPGHNFSGPEILKLYIPMDLSTLPKQRGAADESEVLDLGSGQVVPSGQQNAPDS